MVYSVIAANEAFLELHGVDTRMLAMVIYHSSMLQIIWWRNHFRRPWS